MSVFRNEKKDQDFLGLSCVSLTRMKKSLLQIGDGEKGVFWEESACLINRKIQILEDMEKRSISTILTHDLNRNRIVYWEYLDMIDNPEYANKCAEKYKHII